MKSLMYLKSASSGVLLVTVDVIANEGFFTSMSELMGL
jgi:hypothetical protein